MIDIRQSTLPPETIARATAIDATGSVALGVTIVYRGQRPVTDSWMMDVREAQDLYEQLGRAIRRAG